MERLAEGVAGMRLVGFGPEEGQEGVSLVKPLAQGQVGKQGDPFGLVEDRGESRSGSPLEVGRAQ